MIRNRLSSLLLGAAFSALAFGGALADNAATPPTDQSSQTPAAKPTETAGTPSTSTGTEDKRPGDDVVVCKKMDPPTGSRMGAKKVCHTVGEWRAISDTARDVTNEIQRTGGAENPNGS